MPLQTPRRRISPKTIRRYRAIKDFFKKAIGTLSQTEYRTNSSLTVSVLDLKSKIELLEKQLDNVSKHCRDLSYLEPSSCKESSINCENKAILGNLLYDNRPRDKETKIIYKKPKLNYRKSNECQSIGTSNSNKTIMNDIRHSPNMSNKPHSQNIERTMKLSKRNGQWLKHCQENSDPENKKSQNYLKSYSSVSLKSPREKYNHNENFCSIYPHGDKSYKNGIDRVILKDYENIKKLRHESKRDVEHKKNRKKSPHYSKIDEDFIADIIRKQYKPVKMFGRRLSDFSQFSAPICRDQEFKMRDYEEECELCSCCFEGHRKIRQRYCPKSQYNLSGMRSVCDARLYNSKMQPRHKHVRRNNYNDSTLYDLVPVKEKSSPKARRKTIDDNNLLHEQYREVLPSPRTNKPRLNLKTQRYAYDDCLLPNRCHRLIMNQEINEGCANITQELNKKSKKINTQHGETMSSLQYSSVGQEELNINNETLNTQITVSSTDKTDKALCEIKDILQSFLQEIKKEPTQINSEISDKNIKESNLQVNDKSNCSTTPKIKPSNFIDNVACPLASYPTFNPCCYPVLPIYPINYNPNNYVVPSPSYNCDSCAHNSKETSFIANKTTKANVSCRDETQELIKEIYKCVTQNTSPAKRCNYEDVRHLNLEKKMLTSRSVGSSKASKRDVMVETPKMKCYSKSCEAIGSRMTSDTCYSTNPTLSDTIIEKLSLETSRSSSETYIDRKYKNKKHKFSGVLQKLGLLKRKKKDAIEEVSENESTTEIDVKPNSTAPFKQNILNYNVHGQEFINQPAESRYCRGHSSPHRYICEPRRSPYNICNRGQPPQDLSMPQYYPNSYTASCCCHEHNPHAYHDTTQIQQVQVPLCLKEIEVKSIGTQSDRKLSIFPRFKKNVQSPRKLIQQQKPTTQMPTERNILMNWEKLKEKATKNISSTSNPIKFSLKTQKQLSLGDTKMRNAMIKKLFYKRNPFSPRNLIVRTLLGKDKSSWGDPPRMYKPRMFL